MPFSFAPRRSTGIAVRRNATLLDQRRSGTPERRRQWPMGRCGHLALSSWAVVHPPGGLPLACSQVAPLKLILLLDVTTEVEDLRLHQARTAALLIVHAVPD